MLIESCHDISLGVNIGNAVAKMCIKSSKGFGDKAYLKGLG